MTNEELTVLIQNGDRGKLLDLWEQTERFVWQQARRRMLLSDGRGGVEAEDLYQSGFLALVAAADTFDPDAEMSFVGWLALHLRTVFAEAGGYRSRRQARDPLHRASSLDAPASEDSDTVIAEMIADPGAAEDFQNAEDRLWRKQLHDTLEAALAELPPQQHNILRQRFYQNRTLQQIANTENLGKDVVRQKRDTGLRTLRRREDLRQFVERRTPYYMNWSARSGERTTEMIAIKRENIVYRWRTGDSGTAQ